MWGRGDQVSRECGGGRGDDDGKGRSGVGEGLNGGEAAHLSFHPFNPSNLNY